MTNTVNRFTDRVENYIRYRPHYPQAVWTFLNHEGLLKPNNVIADIGSGTGISSELFLKNGNTVFGVEPNKEMRDAGEKLLAGAKKFTSIAGTAENTTLPNASIDMVVAGQAFHWFDKTKCKEEFKRILKKDSSIVLMWNDRRTDTNAFLKNYEAFLMHYSIDYKEVNHKNLDEKIFDNFFGKGNYKTNAFDNEQIVDFEGLKGRVLSSSYIPDETHPAYHEMINALQLLFDRYQKNNVVTLEYDTRIFYTPLRLSPKGRRILE